MENEKKPDTIENCRKCQEPKVRNQAGTYPNKRDKIFVDANGKKWNGRQCPDCQRSKMNSHMKAKRNKDVQ